MVSTRTALFAVLTLIAAGIIAGAVTGSLAPREPELERASPRLNAGYAHRVPAEARARAEANLDDIAERARAAGVRLILITYPVSFGPSGVANEAIRKVAARRSIPLVGATQSIERLPKEQRRFLWAGHPNPHMYREIARDVADVLLQRVD